MERCGVRAPIFVRTLFCALIIVQAMLSRELLAETASQSQSDRALQLIRDMSELQKLLSSQDQLEREAGIQLGLESKSRALRELALAAVLSRFKSLNPEFVLEQTSSFNLRDLPSIAIMDIRWGDDGRSFNGSAQGYSVSGQVIGDGIAIRYNHILFMERIFHRNSSNANSISDKATRLAQCTASLSLNKSGDALEGPFRCERLPELKVRLLF